MGTLIKDDLFDAQLVRAIGYAPYGGADFGECAATASRITGTDLGSWHDQWFATASRVHDLAATSAAVGRSDQREKRVLPGLELLQDRRTLRDGLTVGFATGRSPPT